MNMPDAYDMWAQEDERRERRLLRRPVCDWCDEHIQEERFYLIDGDYVCQDCIDGCVRNTEDFLEEEAL